MTLQNWLGGVVKRLLHVVGSDRYRSTETFCSSLVPKLQACHRLFSFFPVTLFLLRFHRYLLHPSPAPLTVSPRLLAHLLFVSWRAEPCQPITDTPCYLYLREQETPSAFILFTATCPVLLCVIPGPEHDSRSVHVYVPCSELCQWVLHLFVPGVWWLILLFLFPFCSFFVSSSIQGNIKNTEPLDSKHQRVHTFWVTAFDCGKNRAQADAQVVVTVKPSCKPGWIGGSLPVPDRPVSVLVMIPGSGLVRLRGRAAFNLLLCG